MIYTKFNRREYNNNNNNIRTKKPFLRSPKKDRNDFKPEYIEFDFLFFVLLKISRGKRSIEAKIIVK